MNKFIMASIALLGAFTLFSCDNQSNPFSSENHSLSSYNQSITSVYNSNNEGISLDDDIVVLPDIPLM